MDHLSSTKQFIDEALKTAEQGTLPKGESGHISGHDSDHLLVPEHMNLHQFLPMGDVGEEESHLTAETIGCTRCKKQFEQGPRKYKLCPYCRKLQRERSRRWQQKTKEKVGVCRRCGITMDPGESEQFVLCGKCRGSLRTKKRHRAEEGRCVHCSGENENSAYKVCSRCRSNDKERRISLEKRGLCNRCATLLTDLERDHKVCLKCRNKKRYCKGAGRKSLHEQVDVAEAAAVALANGTKNLSPSNSNLSSNSGAASLHLPDGMTVQEFLLSAQQHLGGGTGHLHLLHPRSTHDPLSMGDANKVCLKCGIGISIDDVNNNGSSNFCGKCLESESNLFMNSESSAQH
ncbi:Putative G-box binding factor [Komagataella phaffii CBS 7435]|uniref:Uncharacterized protein n=2 Tax=Komagataella phaffii TaxID=460519 RepID=C4R0D1_KOMPG|nr:Hypothetical protein PAS_chr2-1_0336 [Komagataella phaffii GS115]AOA62423.1 GQ67_00376T0 [Komagataella phaffii]CAH2448532.1 Putative G-box binding factor [Komagataella phaffii CBS 7435]AOA68190.1 GQ68_01013T0 [Komagataella phaffii GS115]CAY68955.1 Hypothetical protein PAS_chr2-1_0336 [Komagataella phaffii GS115]CCA38644.1 Putative G-box binding factor [Komagataella phaffii CBS 7435]